MNELQMAEFLAGLASTYRASDSPAVVIQAPHINQEKLVKVKRAAKANGASAASVTPKAKKGEPCLADLQPKGTLDGRGYLMAVRAAGNRAVVGGDGVTRIVRLANAVREDTIRAINALVGYDFRGDFGAQETAARAAANRDLRPVIGEEYSRVKVASTITGFVAGACDASTKILRDLKARERLAVDAIATHENDLGTPRANPLGLKLERERLASIREDIGRLA